MTDQRPLRRYIFLDLDDTLYPKSSGINMCVSQRIQQYLSEELNIENAAEKSYQLYLEHGTTLRGLIHEGYNIDQHKFYEYVHTGFTYEDKIEKDDVALIKLLERLKKGNGSSEVKVFLFTNSDMGHATRMMNHLGIKHMFDGFISFEDLELTCKPHRVAFEIAMQIAGVEHDFAEQKMGNQSITPLEIYFFDDNVANVNAALNIGWHNAIWINERRLANNFDLKEMENIHQIDQICPELFE